VGWLAFLLDISDREATFARRGFLVSDPHACSHLERCARSFLTGYRTALAAHHVQSLREHLDRDSIEEFRGFAYEGAAMALTLTDHLVRRRDRFRLFLEGPGEHHAYMLHVGTGWALARLPWLRRRPARFVARLDPLLGWLAIDGYGFHEGFFHAHRTIGRQRRPIGLSGYAHRAFDQGLGRSLWFVTGADIASLASTIARFAAGRRADLWSGAGLAATYAGGVERESLEQLRAAAGEFLPHVAQGAAFAAKARLRAGNPVPHTEHACAILCGRSLAETAAVTDAMLERLPDDVIEPRYETWRRRVRHAVSREGMEARR
jgi:hypothetical protein